MKRIIFLILAISISISTLAQDSGDLDSKFYFRFGYSNPTGSYLGVDDNTFWDDFSKAGGTFELGSIFMLNSAPLADGLRIGINVDYLELSYNQLTSTVPNTDFAVGLLKLSSKVGPTLSFSPASKLVFDLFVKAKIPWVGGMVLWADGEVDEGFIAGPGFGVATGLNFRYRFLMLGFEFDTDNMKYESQDYPGEYFGNLSEDSDKTPTPAMIFTLGFCF